mmetsp:Transcript_29054/g.43924  ORF Transcript_29054/g.43924 Transcript_29054/m.43924 type:complete len:120 (-) Transcript_29054:174-533(-)
MPKFYCEYCDLYLTHSGLSGRRQHLTGRRHINNKIEYYQMLIREKGLTPPIYPPPPGMVLPMPKLPAGSASATLPTGATGTLPTGMPTLSMPGMARPTGLPGMPTMGMARPGFPQLTGM